MSNHETSPNGGSVGMWFFIAIETVLFGGLFLLYSIYRFKNPDAFHEGSSELSLFFGTINTGMLITSSFTMALALNALRLGKQGAAIFFILSTIVFAFGFLSVKAIEWSTKFEHGLYPSVTMLMGKPTGENLFFGLYFMMTGLHALHVIAGIGVLTVAMILIAQDRVRAAKPLFLENAGLFWHLVDVIWIFLFPLFYLIT
jgi:cytochrome c oxidase subunit III